MIEQVYNQYYNTAGNYHWTGVHSGDHILRKGEEMTRNEAIEILNTIPTIGEQVDALEMAIEALERKRGEWIDGLDIPKEERERHPYVYLHGDKYCSVCYKEAYYDTDYGQQLFDYCPNCGAKMEGEEE